jgi:hypothetical protein
MYNLLATPLGGIDDSRRGPIMIELTQLNRPLKIFTALGPDTIFLIRCSGVEAVSELFRFKLELVALNSTPVPFEKPSRNWLDRKWELSFLPPAPCFPMRWV